jgi:O-antigen ligase
MQAVHTVSALERARAEWPWAGALVLEHYQPLTADDDPRWGFALVGQDGVPRPVLDAVSAWASSLPNAAAPGGYPARNPWARYEGSWQVGPLAADIGASGDRATFRFDGDSVALTVRRGAYRADVYVTVDGQPANALPQDKSGRAYLVLYDKDSQLATVPLATDLPPGSHTVEIEAERGWDQWAIVDWRVGTADPPTGLAWQLALVVAAAVGCGAALARDLRCVPWTKLAHAFLAWPARSQAVLAAALAGAIWATVAAALSLGRGGATSAWAWAGLAGLLATVLLSLGALLFVMSVRTDLGVSLAAFAAPLYLVPAEMIYGALSMAEILLLVGAVGSLIRDRVMPGTSPGRSLKLTAADWAVLGYVLVAALRTALADDLGVAFFEFRSVHLLPALFYVGIRLGGLGREMALRIVTGWALGGAVVAIVGIVQYALGTKIALAEGGLARLRSVYYSPNSVALYLGRLWPLLVAGSLWGPSPHRRRWLAVVLAIVSVALVLTFSRGALLLGLPAAVLVMGWWAGGRYRWAALALAGAGALALVPLMSVPRFASLLDTAVGSTFVRLELWRSTLAMIQDHPVLGVGPGQFANAYRTRYILPTAWSEPDLTHPHNIVLDHLTRLGVPGLLAFGAVQYAFWRVLWLRRRDAGDKPYTDPLHIGLAGSMIALLLHGLADNTLFSPDMAAAFYLTLGLGCAVRARTRSETVLGIG